MGAQLSPTKPKPPSPRALDAFFADSDLGRRVFDRVRATVEAFGPVEIRVGESEVALRRRRGFAFVWLPGKYLRRPDAEVVLSIALPRHLASPRFKEVVQPSSRVWMHHLEVHGVRALDAEARGWLREAWEAAG